MAEGVERGDNSAMSQNSSLMSGVDCLLTTWAPDQMYCPQATISNLILFNTILVEQTLPWRRQRVPLDQEAGPLLQAIKSVKIKLLSVLFCAPSRCRDLEHWTCAPSPIVGASDSSKRCGSSPPSAGRRQTRRGRSCPKTSLSTRWKLATGAVT